MSEVWTKLRATLTLDPSEYKAGAKEVGSITSSMQSVVTKAAGAMGVAFSAAAVFNYAKEIAKAADATVDAAKGLNMTTAALVGLQRVGARSGIGGDKVIQWLQKLEDMSADLAMSGGTSAFGKQLEAMGINVREFLGLPIPERLMLLINKANESALGVSALNAALGKGAALEAKEAYTELARDGLGTVAEEADRAAKAIETLASVWSGGEKGGAGIKNWTSEMLANLVETNRMFVRLNRNGGPAPSDPADRVAEGVGSTAATLALNVVNLVSPRIANWIARKIQNEVPEDKGDIQLRFTQGGPTDMQAQFDKAEDTRAGKQKDTTAKRLNSIRDAYTKFVSAHLEGEAKLRDEIVGAKMEHEEAVKALELRYAKETAGEKNEFILAGLKEEYDQTLRYLKAMRDARIAAAEKAMRVSREQKKQEAMEAAVSAVAKLNERESDIRRNTRGAGINADAMARIGGFMGGERPGLAIADRQLKVMEQIAVLTKEIRDAQFKVAEAALHPGLPEGGSYY